jgi:hypothetical protein
LSCRYAAEIPIVHSFDRSSFVHSSYSLFVHSPYSSFFQIIFVLPLCCRNSDHSIVRPFVHSSYSSFIVTIHHSSFVHTTIHHHYSQLLFIIVTIHCYYSSTLFMIVTVYRYYSSSLLFIDDIYGAFSSLLFIDHPIIPNFNYSSIMLSSPPKTSQTHIPVIRTPVTVIFLPVGNFPSGHPSQVSPC